MPRRTSYAGAGPRNVRRSSSVETRRRELLSQQRSSGRAVGDANTDSPPLSPMGSFSHQGFSTSRGYDAPVTRMPNASYRSTLYISKFSEFSVPG